MISLPELLAALLMGERRLRSASWRFLRHLSGLPVLGLIVWLSNKRDKARRKPPMTLDELNREIRRQLGWPDFPKPQDSRESK